MQKKGREKEGEAPTDLSAGAADPLFATRR